MRGRGCGRGAGRAAYDAHPNCLVRLAALSHLACAYEPTSAVPPRHHSRRPAPSPAAAPPPPPPPGHRPAAAARALAAPPAPSTPNPLATPGGAEAEACGLDPPPAVCAVSCGEGHVAALSRDGRVWTWGLNSEGQLGLGDDRQRAAPTPVPTLPAGSRRVRLLACGGAHTLLATAGDELFAFGANGFGQLGLGTRRGSNAPQRVAALSGQAVRCLAAGATHSLVALAAGGDSRGGLVAFGSNDHLQLGTRSRNAEAAPTLVPAFRGVGVVSLAAGRLHSAAVTEAGRCHTWGGGRRGQLGQGEHRDVVDPYLVQFGLPQSMAREPRALQVSCGEFHTAVVVEVVPAVPAPPPIERGREGAPPEPLRRSEERDRFAQRGALALGSSPAPGAGGHATPGASTGAERVGPAGRGPASPSLPPSATRRAAEAGARRGVWAFGSGREGQLGQGNAHDSSLPQEVGQLRHEEVVSVACGSAHTLAACRSGMVFAWGRNSAGQLGLGLPPRRPPSAAPRRARRARARAHAARGRAPGAQGTTGPRLRRRRWR